MKFSILERLLVANRPRSKVSSLGFSSDPVALRFASPPDEAPWVTSLTTGAFTLTRPNRDGDVGQGFFQCPVEDEDVAFERLWRRLWELSLQHGWNNLCGSLRDGIARMISFGLEPKSVVVPFASLKDVVGGEELTAEDVEALTLRKGCIAEIDGVQVISGRESMPPSMALITTGRPLVGVYNRINDSLGITLTRADKSVVLVVGDAVG